MKTQTTIRLPDTSMTLPLACLLSAYPSISTGKERDLESGNDYFGARYYASTMGRFMSPDWSAKEEPVPYATMNDPQSLNLYAYVRNNPLRGVDPDGHEYLITAPTEEDNSHLQRKPLLQNSFRKLLSTMNRKSGILVIVHSIPPGKLIRRRTSFSQSDRMDNLLRHHS